MAKMNLKRVDFEHATDAELVIASSGEGAEERYKGLLYKDRLNAHDRVTLIRFLRSMGFNSIQVDLSDRVSSPSDLVDFETAKAMRDLPDATMSPGSMAALTTRDKAINFFQLLGLTPHARIDCEEGMCSGETTQKDYKAFLRGFVDGNLIVGDFRIVRLSETTVKSPKESTYAEFRISLMEPGRELCKPLGILAFYTTGGPVSMTLEASPSKSN